VLPFHRTAIFLHDPKKDVLRLRMLEASLPSAYFAVGLEVPSGESHVGWVFQHRHPLLRRDLEAEREYPAEDWAYADGVRSYIIVPLIARGTSVGTLAVASTQANQYTEADGTFLQEIANQVALAVENMKAYEEIAALKARLERENVYLQEEIRTQHNFEEIVGNSPALLGALRKVEKVAGTDSTVLILGETGTGKELLARAIHSRSARKGRPLVKVNCGAIPVGLIESELFGHVKGAFTGALQNRIGRFELADGGTIFLDEVGELPLETQVKLMRVLQEQEFEPVGSSRTVRVNVRVIAATNRNLEEAVRAGRFRADLLYRLNVFPIEIPPLRERRSDIPLLIAFYLTGFARRLGKPLTGFSRESMERLIAYSWPGNVRELQNAVERAAILAQGPVLDLETGLLPQAEGPAAGPKGPRTLEDLTRSHILDALRSSRGVVEGPRGAARLLGLHPNTLRSRMKKLGIERSSHEIS
jgi:formate hydrogenlyase transcriptional activator